MRSTRVQFLSVALAILSRVWYDVLMQGLRLPGFENLICGLLKLHDVDHVCSEFPDAFLSTRCYGPDDPCPTLMLLHEFIEKEHRPAMSRPRWMCKAPDCVLVGAMYPCDAECTGAHCAVGDRIARNTPNPRRIIYEVRSYNSHDDGFGHSEGLFRSMESAKVQVKVAQRELEQCDSAQPPWTRGETHKSLSGEIVHAWFSARLTFCQRKVEIVEREVRD